MLSWSGESATLVAPAEPPGRLRRWRAEQEGRPAVVVQAIMNGPEEASQAGERLRRLAAHPDPNLQAVRGWAVQQNEAWAITDPDEGSSLASLLRSGPLPPAAAAAVGWWVLSGLEALHAAGVAHGDLTAANVRIDEDGRVTLRNHLFNGGPRASGDDTRADVEAAGALVAAALGMPLQGGAGTPLTTAEEGTPALARTVRAIANGASGGNVSGARMALSATAGPLVQPEALAAASAELARRNPIGASSPALVRGEDRPAPPAALPPRRYIATASDFEELRPGLDWSRFALPAAIAGGLLLLVAVGFLVLPRLFSAGTGPVAARTPAPAASHAPTTRPTGAQPTPRPSGPPNFGPASSGDVKSVLIAPNGGCAVGGQCAVEVTVKTTTAGAPNDVAWTIRSYDPCTGTLSDLGTDKVTEQNGWNTVIGDRTVTLPASRAAIQLVAVTSAPATAASPSISVGTGSC